MNNNFLKKGIIIAILGVLVVSGFTPTVLAANIMSSRPIEEINTNNHIVGHAPELNHLNNGGINKMDAEHCFILLFLPAFRTKVWLDHVYTQKLEALASNPSPSIIISFLLSFALFVAGTGGFGAIVLPACVGAAVAIWGYGIENICGLDQGNGVYFQTLWFYWAGMASWKIESARPQ